MRRTILPIALLLSAVAWTDPAQAFDGSRKGFTLEIGLGGGFQSASQEHSFLNETEEVDASGPAFVTNVKIGYGFNEQLIVAWTDNLGISSGESILTNKDESLALSVGGIGLTYFFNADGPSPFIDVTIGVSAWDDGNDGNRMSGMGISVGGGYEFKPNWAAGVDLGWGNPSDDVSLFSEKISEVSSTNISVGLHVSHLWY